MKKTSNIKKTLLLATFITTVVLFAACSNRQRTQDTKDVAQERNEERFDENRQRKDAQFLVNASEINLRQIQLGQLAQQRGSTAHVKELGKNMEEAHAKSQRDLTALARRKSITIPTSPTHDVRDAYEDLSKKSGNDFDKEYTDMMVSNNEDAIDTFENAASDNYDTDIRNYATTTLRELRKHRDHALESQRKNDDMAVRNR